MAGVWMGMRWLTGIGWTGPSWTWHTCIHTHTLVTLYARSRKNIHTSIYTNNIHICRKGSFWNFHSGKMREKIWLWKEMKGLGLWWRLSRLNHRSCLQDGFLLQMHIYITQALTHTIKKGNAIPLFGWGWFGWLRLVGMRIGLSGLYVGYTLWNSEKILYTGFLPFKLEANCTWHCLDIPGENTPGTDDGTASWSGCEWVCYENVENDWVWYWVWLRRMQ